MTEDEGNREYFELPDETIKKTNRKRKKKKRKGCFVLVLIFFACIFAFAAVMLAIKLLPSFKVMDYYEYYYMINKNEIHVVLQDDILPLENPPVQRDGQIYLPVDFIKEHFDKYIFWEEDSSLLTITTKNRVIKITAENPNYYINNEPFILKHPIYNIDSTAFIPCSLLEELYPIHVEYEQEYNAAIIDYSDREMKRGSISEPATMRFEADKKSPVIKKLENQDVIILGLEDGYTKIRTNEGLIGYIKSAKIDSEEVFRFESKYKPEQEQYVQKPAGNITAVWDQVTVAEANRNDNRRIRHKGVNILIPTWFSFDEDKLNGDVISIGDLDYVNWAHDNNIQVWGLVTDSFSSKICHAVISTPEAREKAIQQLLAQAASLRLDGINIDFEMVSGEDAPYYIQFLRELAPLVHQQGMLLSVDMYVPSASSSYYNRKAVSEVADYICVMTYDEHWGVGSGSGPTASLGFVEDGIKDTLNEGVPKDQIIMGIPFYVRIWKEWEGGLELYRTLGIEGGYDFFVRNQGEFKWLEDIGSYYCEFSTVEDGVEVTYKVWLEDKESIEEKLKIYKETDIAGVAGWRRGLETEEIWDLIYEYLKCYTSYHSQS